MKDHLWLAVFSVFTLIVGFLFTYGNGVRADADPLPIQVFVMSTTTPSAPVIIREPSGGAGFTPPTITVNVIIATSSLALAPQAQATTPTRNKSSSHTTYYVTNNTYEAATTTEEVADTITLTIQGLYDATTTPIENGETVLALLTRLHEGNPGLDVTTQDYGDMGVLVTGMGGDVNGTDGKYWQYQVNAVSPMIGADQYELKADDVVLWEFKGF